MTTSYAADSVGGKLHNLMTERGLRPVEADAVLSAVQTAKQHAALAKVLSTTWDDYPEDFHAVAWVAVNAMVIEYIDANKPQHFARSMFAANRI